MTGEPRPKEEFTSSPAMSARTEGVSVPDSSAGPAGGGMPPPPGAGKRAGSRSPWFVGVGFAASGALVWGLARRFEWQSFKEAVAGLSLPLVALAILVYLAAFLSRARRCQLILGPTPPVSLAGFLKALFVGCALNGLLPFRLGELGRAFYLQAREDLGATLALGTIVTERVFDVALLALGALVLTTTIAVPDWLLARRPMLGGLLLAVCAAGLVGSWLLRGWLKRQAPPPEAGPRESAPALQPVLEGVQRFIDGLRIVSRPGDLVAALGWTGVAILMESFSYLLLLHSMNVKVPFGLAFFCFIAIMFSGLLPAAPGNLGIVQYVAIMVLSVGGVPEQTALNFSLVLTALLYLPATFGLLVLVLEGFSPMWQAWRGS